MAQRIRRTDWSADTPVLKIVTAINVAVFLAWHTLPEAWMQDNFTTSWAHLAQGRIWTLLTSELSHQSFEHIFFNLFALWLFGRDVERVVGSRGFLHLYVAGGIVASLGYALYGLLTLSTIPALGASGAVMAIIVVAARLFPRRLLLLFFFIPMTQRFAVFWFILLDLVGLVRPNGDNVAHAAHLAGAYYGWRYYNKHAAGYLRERIAQLSPKRTQRNFRHPVA